MPHVVTIKKPLVLFPAETGDLNQHHVITEGSYALEPVANPLNPKGEPWLKIVGESWGNAKSCWDALLSQPRIRTSLFDSRVQIVAGVLGLFCVCLAGLTLVVPSFKEKLPDVAALKLELLGLNNQMDNLTNHYPLMVTAAQKRYEQQREQAIYGLDAYPVYLAYRNSRQQAILRSRPDLGAYVTAINNLDEQLYHAWHDWGLTNRSSMAAGLKKQQLRFASGEVMPEQSAANGALNLPIYWLRISAGVA